MKFLLDNKRTAVLALLVSLLGAAALFFGSPATAGSEACTDGSPTNEIGVTLTTWPVYTSVVVYPGAPYGVGVCYATPAAPGTTGGNVIVQADPVPGGVAGHPRCEPDAGVRQPIACSAPYSATASPTYSTTGGTVTVSIPFGICLAGCVGASPNMAKTGVVIGTLTPVSGPSGATGAAYGLSGLEIWLDGTLVFAPAPIGIGGAYVDYSFPGVTLPSLSGSNPPCVSGGICMPTGMLGVTGATETVTLVLPTGTTTIPITIPSKCLINFSGSCP